MNTADYVAAATAIAEGSTPAPAAPAAPEVKTEAAPAGSTAPAKTPEVAAPAEPEAKPVEKPAEPAKSRAEVSMEAVAAGKAALRKEREAMEAEYAPYKELAAAKKSGSAMAVLAAAGISWKDAAREVLEGGAGPAAQKPEKDEPSPLAAEVAELRNKLAAREAAETKAKVSTQVAALIKDNPKFKHISGLDAGDEVLSYIERYHRETGELPGQTLAESLEIAAEAVEGHLAKEAQRWAKVLPASSAPVTTPAKAEVPAEATSKQAKTLTNSTGSGPLTATVAKKPKSPEEYRQAALDALSAQ